MVLEMPMPLLNNCRCKQKKKKKVSHTTLILLSESASWAKVLFRTCRHLKQPPWSSGSWDKSTFTISVFFKISVPGFFFFFFFYTFILSRSISTLGGLLGHFPEDTDKRKTENRKEIRTFIVSYSWFRKFTED